MSSEIKPIIAISIGDPNGIGAEIIFKSLARKDIQQLGTYVIFVPGKLWAFFKKTFSQKVYTHQIEKLEDIRRGKINVFSFEADDLKIEWGTSQPEAGKLSFQSLNFAVDAVKNGFCHILVTAPINKSNIQSDAFSFPGHTEYLENQWGGNNLMFMVHEDIKVGLVTQHIPLKEVSEKITKDLIISKLILMNQSLKNDYGITQPIIAVTGLNPHAGDKGLLGKEEEEIIIPAIKKALGRGIKAFGPYSSDSYFSASNLKKVDAVLAMYHDQGLTPFKTLAGIEGVNFTAGLPFVRTSPDHGVGYDIAGEDKADETSMVEAIYTAVNVYRQRELQKALEENALPIEAVSDKRKR